MNDSKDGHTTQEADETPAETATDTADEEATAAAVEASPEGADAAPGAEKEEVDPLEEARAEAARWQDLALRSQADLDNYRKRMAREKADAISYANASLLEDLLPTLDNFSRGLELAREDESSTIFQGMSMVLKQIEDFLRDQGVEPIETADADFDPNLHEAVAQEFSDTVAEGKVIRELRRGFKLKDRLLRASNIIVSKGPQSDAPAEASPGKEEDNTEA